MPGLYSVHSVVRLSQPESLASLAGNNNGAGESDDGDHGDGGEAGVTGDRRLGGLGRRRSRSRGRGRRSLGGGNGLGLGLVVRRLGRVGIRGVVDHDFGQGHKLPHNLIVGERAGGNGFGIHRADRELQLEITGVRGRGEFEVIVNGAGCVRDFVFAVQRDFFAAEPMVAKQAQASSAAISTARVFFMVSKSFL